MDDPQADAVTVKQTLQVQLAYFPTLYTSATLPYAPAVRERFPVGAKFVGSESGHPFIEVYVPAADAGRDDGEVTPIASR